MEIILQLFTRILYKNYNFLSLFLKYLDYSVSAEVLLRMMQTNPALADKLMMQNNRDNRDDESIMDHSKSDRIFALI